MILCALSFCWGTGLTESESWLAGSTGSGQVLCILTSSNLSLLFRDSHCQPILQTKTVKMGKIKERDKVHKDGEQESQKLSRKLLMLPHFHFFLYDLVSHFLPGSWHFFFIVLPALHLLSNLSCTYHQLNSLNPKFILSFSPHQNSSLHFKRCETP